MTGYDPVAAMRRGDPSAWPRLRPEFLDARSLDDAWAAALARRGRPGAPDRLRVYAHFPYCESSCNFCMYFHQVPRETGAYGAFVDYLVARIERFAGRVGRQRAAAAYLGGGTPGATPAPELARFLAAFRAAFDVEGEFTLEAHPNSMDEEKLAIAAARGVNRVSMGLQSLAPDVLRAITRRNRPLEHVGAIVAAAQRHGMLVNVDLCLGLPGQTLASFRDDVSRLLALGPDAVTLYRYHPVARLPTPPAAHMHYAHALDDATRAGVAARGYLVGDPITDDATTVRLLNPRAHAVRTSPAPVYALFDEEASHLLGFGPGAYGHLYGHAWYREVTSMDALDASRAVFWGTRMAPEDECRAEVLAALADGRAVDAERLRVASGVDVRERFRDALREATAAGVVRGAGARLEFAREAPAGARERLADALMPPAPREPSSEGAEPRAPGPYQRELVVLRRERGGPASPADAALVRAFCDAIGVAGKGRRALGALVRDVDDRSVHFAVGRADAPPLRVHVRPAGWQPAFLTTSRFAVAYGNRPDAPLSADERAFLARLADALRAHDAATRAAR